MDGVESSTGARVLVTGQTALGVDISESLSNAFPRYLLVVVGLAFLLLTIVFRSLVVPLKAMLGFLLSVADGAGCHRRGFQWGWLASLIGVEQDRAGAVPAAAAADRHPVRPAMDYEVFLVSRMREEYVHGRPAGEAVVHGFQYGARVVTAAAAIMIGVFGRLRARRRRDRQVDRLRARVRHPGRRVPGPDDPGARRSWRCSATGCGGCRAGWTAPLPNLDIEGEALARHTADEAPGKHRRELQPVE